MQDNSQKIKMDVLEGIYDRCYEVDKENSHCHLDVIVVFFCFAELDAAGSDRHHIMWSTEERWSSRMKTSA